MRPMNGVRYRRRARLFFLLLAGGCSSSGGSTFSTLSLAVSSTGYDATLSGPGCPTLGDVSVTFDGEAGQVIFAGGTVRDLSGSTRCQAAELGLTKTIDFTQATPATDVTVGGGATVHAVFTQLIAPVTLEISGTPPLTPGSMVTFALNPSSDVFLAAGVGPKLRWDTPAGTVPASDARIAGGIITASIPSSVSAGDPLSFSYGQGLGVIQAATATCVGVGTCAGYPQVFVDPVQITVK